MKKISKFFIFLALGALIFDITVAKAAVRPTNATVSQEIIDKRCNLVNSKISLLITRYENNKQRHILKYEKIKERMIGINKILKSRGCDTSKVENDYQKLDTMIVEFSKEYNNFINLLKTTQNYVCGKSQGDYLKSLNQARQQLIIVRQKSLDIRNFWQGTIRQDLIQLKEQCKNMLTPTNTQ